MAVSSRLLLALAVPALADQRQLSAVPTCPANSPVLQDSWGCPQESLSGELLSDSSLSSRTAWDTYLSDDGGGATFDFSGNGLAANSAPDGDSTSWHVQILQPVTLDQDGEEGFYYSLCVQAAGENQGIIEFAVDADGALNFAVAGGGVRSKLTIAADWQLRSQCFKFRLGPSEKKYSGRVAINLGATEGLTKICQASLRRCNVQPAVGGLAPIRRCYLPPLMAEKGCEKLENRQGTNFGLNRFGQETTGKANCLRDMRELKGDTFVFSIGQCEVWKCGSKAKLLEATSGAKTSQDVFSKFCEYDDPMQGRSPVYVQLWEWNFADIGRECEEFLGPNGFDGVQVSPVTEHILGSEWFTKYQPVSFKLHSRSGSEEEFRNMVARCRKAGVQIIVDVILNHIAAPCKEASRAGGAAIMPCKGWAGSPWGNRRINSDEGWKGPELFHHINGNLIGNCPVLEETGDEDAWTCPQSDPPGDCSLCDFKGLPDWNTGLQSVQDTLAKHLEELHDIGVTMLRLDAASYVATSETAAIINRLPWDLVYQEWWGGVPAEERSVSVGHYRDAKYGLKITQALAISDVKYMPDMLNISHGLDGIPSDRAVYPLTFHDQRTFVADRFTPTYKNGVEFHQQQKFLLAWPRGNGVRLWGGYTWKDLDAGPPGRCGSAKCSPTPVYLLPDRGPDCMQTPREAPLSKQEELYSGWVCEHRWDGVAGLVNFRKACRGLPLTQTWSEHTVPAVGRGQFGWRAGDKCFAGLVRGHNTQYDSYWGKLEDWRLAGMDLGLPPGRYCDLASLKTQRCWDRQSCPREITIGQDGIVVKGVVGEGDLVAIHVGARLNDEPQTVNCDPVTRDETEEADGTESSGYVAAILVSIWMCLFS